MARTDDTSYGEDYWGTLDGGAGYQDSVMWQDIAHAISEVVFIDWETGRDRAGEFRAIDVGCAHGYLVLNLRKRGCETFGLDYSRYALAQAPPQVADAVQWFDLTADDDSFFGRGQFSLLTCFETLEHIPPEASARAVRHLWDLMKPGAAAVITICVEGQPDPHDDPTHVNVAPRSFWTALFRSQGFRVWPPAYKSIMRFWLFSQHKGVFVLAKPE